METLLLIAGAVLGGAIAYVDSRPTWDDTGITVLALFAAGAVLGLIRPKRAWKWGLAVGIWLPLVEILLTRNYLLALVLLIPLAGAYGGALAHKVLRPA